MSQPISLDQRKSQRHEINIVATLLCDEAQYSVRVLDISTGGAKIELTASTLEKDQTVQIDLPFLNTLNAIVIWSNGQNCGLKFLEDQKQLHEFLYNLATYGQKCDT